MQQQRLVLNWMMFVCFLWNYIVLTMWWLCVAYSINNIRLSNHILTSSFTPDFHKPTACSLMFMFSCSCEGLVRIIPMDIPKSFQGTRSRSFQSTWRTSWVMGATPLVKNEFRNGFPGIWNKPCMDKIAWDVPLKYGHFKPGLKTKRSYAFRISPESSLSLTECIEATIAPPSPTPQIVSFQTVTLKQQVIQHKQFQQFHRAHWIHYITYYNLLCLTLSRIITPVLFLLHLVHHSAFKG